MRFQVEITQKMAAVVEINAPDEDAALQEANEMISKDIISSDSFHMEDNILIFTRPANGRLQRKF